MKDLKLLRIHYIIADFNLLNCELDDVTFSVLY